MTWHQWLFLGLGVGLVVYLLVRFWFIWFFCGGNSGGDYYSDSEK